MKDALPPEDPEDLYRFEIFSELETLEGGSEGEEDFALEDLNEDLLERQRKYRADLYLQPLELAEKRMELLQITEEERKAVEKAALAIIEHQAKGRVKRSAEEYLDEVSSGDVHKWVRLANCALPLARSFSSSFGKTEEEV